MKSLLILSSFLVLSAASFLTQSEINVTFDTPSSVKAGESFIMNIEIDKGNISDFAKLQLSLPEGFTAEMLEGKEGTFTFYDQKIKLIWISLPEDPKFNVKVKIECDTSLTGDYNFNGKISYVLEGERKNKELTSPTITVSPKTKSDTQSIASSNTINNSVSSKTNQSSSKTSLSCTRLFEVSQVEPGKTFLVTLKVNKSNVSGVGKIIENIPDGFIAKEIENNGAIFSQKGNQVKFLWMTLPSENEFTVSYKIMVDANIQGNKVITGKMSYLDGDITKNSVIDETSIEITNSPKEGIQTAGIEKESNDLTTDSKKNNTSSGEFSTNTSENSSSNTTTTNNSSTNEKNNAAISSENIASNNTQKEIPGNNNNVSNPTSKVENNINSSTTTNDNTTVSDNNKSSTETSVATEDKATNEVVSSTNEKETVSSVKSNNTVPESEENNSALSNETVSNHSVNYRVQICALRKKTETSYFVKNHNVKEKIYLNMHEGWHKYTVGDFKEYMSAREHRSTAKSNYKINGSFVTAYNNGSRITVQEALMITKDKWVAP